MGNPLPSKPAPSLQTVILALQTYWADQGCVIWQPHHTEVGAGTMNPATFLRVLGPEPWNVAYVEPSIRPTDGRYGENPNRWQHYYQFQVILKPDPGDSQERYLRSLVALGIDPARHDIRFVEDNWEAPALGAWGLGWEVWLDGQEITQFTYLQQAGGQTLEPVSVEITYGLERILMALQDVDTFVDIAWNDRLTYGDLHLQAEKEHSLYNFERADVERLRLLFDEYEAEAKASLAAGLVFPAHDHVLKCSHAFNILDARGAIGVTERAALFGRMRDLARGVAEAYLAQRQAQGFPWLRSGDSREPATRPPEGDRAAPPSAPAPFLLEIGTEELPVEDLEAAISQLEQAFTQLLDEARLSHGPLKVMGTPRRLLVSVEDLLPRQAERLTLVKGPPADRAFDGQGRPTQAALGFARSRGVGVEVLRVQEIEGGRYAVAEVREPGDTADHVLASRIPEILAGLRFDRSMRWGAAGVTFSRPIRWILCLHGEHVVPLNFAGLHSGRITRGLRFQSPEGLRVRDPGDLLFRLKQQGIAPDIAERQEKIRQGVEALAAEVGGRVSDDPALLREVANLVESPVALRGSFEARYLELPRQVLVEVMRKHQRYFAVERDGRLLPYFITVRNGGSQGMDLVAHGNEQVIRARFADAAYFIRKDLEKPLEAHLPRLATLAFQARLGSMLDKSARLERLAAILAQDLGLSASERSVVARAAHLSKADLATQMVVEMTGLQGEMGREYALRSGESPEVANAILEHRLPRFAGDRTPESKAGLVVGLADRLDTLAGLFAAGMEPSGAKDPFALRRAAIGLAQNLIAHRQRFDVRRGLAQAAAGLPIQAPPKAIEACLAFINSRLKGVFEADHRHDVVEAVLAAQGHDPAGAAKAVTDLGRWVAHADWPETLQAFARCVRITRDQPAEHELSPDRLTEPAEQALFEALRRAEARPRDDGSVEDLLTAFTPMIPAITRFFDEVLVMAEEEALRANRLGLLQRVAALSHGVADLSRVEGF